MLHALVFIHMLQADILQADTHATPCSQPLAAFLCHCSSMTHGTGSVTDIPQLSNTFNIVDDFNPAMYKSISFYKGNCAYVAVFS